MTAEERFDRLDAALDALDAKLDAKLDGLDHHKLDALDGKLDDLAAEVRAQLREILRRLPG